MANLEYNVKKLGFSRSVPNLFYFYTVPITEKRNAGARQRFPEIGARRIKPSYVGRRFVQFAGLMRAKVPS